MLKGLVGKKVGMTQVFDTDGKVSPVTIIEAATCSDGRVAEEEELRVVAR